jgi:hypothetical protein
VDVDRAGEPYSIVTPLVANLTDDNGDGAIDLCDVPDVVVVASTSSGSPTSSATSTCSTARPVRCTSRSPRPVDHTVTPAIGDIDGDGLPEIVASVVGGNPVVFEHDGTQKWVSASNWPEATRARSRWPTPTTTATSRSSPATACSTTTGVLLFTAPQPAGNWSSSAFADLDGDKRPGDRARPRAYHHDGAALLRDRRRQPGYPSIANLDADPEPEVLVTNMNGLSLINHDGTVQYQDQRPTGDFPGSRPGCGRRRSTTSTATGSRSSRPARPTTTRCTTRGADDRVEGGGLGPERHRGGHGLRLPRRRRRRGDVRRRALHVHLRRRTARCCCRSRARRAR